MVPNLYILVQGFSLLIYSVKYFETTDHKVMSLLPDALVRRSLQKFGMWFSSVLRVPAINNSGSRNYVCVCICYEMCMWHLFMTEIES